MCQKCSYLLANVELAINSEIVVQTIRVNPPDFSLSKKSLNNLVGFSFLSILFMFFRGFSKIFTSIKNELIE
jgi:hypothetical protein